MFRRYKVKKKMECGKVRNRVAKRTEYGTTEYEYIEEWKYRPIVEIRRGNAVVGTFRSSTRYSESVEALAESHLLTEQADASLKDLKMILKEVNRGWRGVSWVPRRLAVLTTHRYGRFYSSLVALAGTLMILCRSSETGMGITFIGVIGLFITSPAYVDIVSDLLGWRGVWCRVKVETGTYGTPQVEMRIQHFCTKSWGTRTIHRLTIPTRTDKGDLASLTKLREQIACSFMTGLTEAGLTSKAKYIPEVATFAGMEITAPSYYDY